MVGSRRRALGRILRRGWSIFEKQNVLCRFFERQTGKVPRPGPADHDADKNGDGKLLPAEDVGKTPPTA
jgi:hypothetical protein